MTSANAVNSAEKSQNSRVCPRMWRMSIRNISRSLKALSVLCHTLVSVTGCGPSWTCRSWASSSACNWARLFIVWSASVSVTTGNKFACCMRKKSSHKKSLTPNSRANALSTSGRSREASSVGQSSRRNSWLMNWRKCSSADSGLGDWGSRCEKCLIRTEATRSWCCFSGAVILCPFASVT